ncbi:polysaccharide lyase 8 family protein [Spongiactinospora sp. TRM90649]|uniref:polysaccharide lyase 8 family protein n=1 Tax=Spongiactinospora sp. TRM90649 TaxID=3031114 RepID=UPI0023F651BD|nr:polysaccharide lyase 8 family protein [Spongiactinospora sp. TRM90649]MDF5754783.1 polysaccharide lyase 8 family protein [Spongiactinospora sp. TRM90649]
MHGPRRRLVLQFGAVGVAGAVGALFPTPPAHTPDTSFTVLRRRWREVTAGAAFDPSAEPYRTRLAELGAVAARHRDTMAPAAGSLWPDQPFPSFVATPARLRAMARAYVLPGTGLTGDAGLAGAVARGIGHYRELVYPATAREVGNWWHWQIGVPRALLDAAVLIEPHLPEPESAALRDSVDRFVPERRLARYSGTSTAANRVDLCTVTLLRAMLRSDHARAALAASALAPVFPLVGEGDGFYRDGSFIQHTSIPYQGAYGATLLSALATLFAVLRGSPWEVTSTTVFDMVERSFAPFVHDGFCMDLVRGRSVAREPFGDHRRGREIAASILLLGDTAPVAYRARWHSMVKGWAGRSAHPPMLDAAERHDLAFHGRLAAILADDSIPAAEEPVGHRLFPMSARAVHREPGWCAALSMASEWIGHYEYGNGENLRGWHTGSGMLYWWARGHGDQYSDSFWSTVDPYRLPGTTVSTRRLPDGAGGAWGDTRPAARWVGGATDGRYATAGQHLLGLESTLAAFKSWVFLDDAIVCLGAGITAADSVPVETVVDNRRTTAALTVDRAAGFAHLAGHGGYVLPGAPPLRTLREARTASGVTRRYVTLWLDHGTDPTAADYVYLLLPGASPAETRARAADPGWARVLANSAVSQGVHVPSLGVTAVNFWQPGTAGPLTASAPCAVLVREPGDGTATVTVSDPRRSLTGLTVTWNRPVAGVTQAHPLLTLATAGPALTLGFGPLDGREGASHTVGVRLA